MPHTPFSHVSKKNSSFFELQLNPTSTPPRRNTHLPSAPPPLTQASLDEAKVRKAMEQQKRGEAVGEGGKRKYNSMTSDAVDAEAMEAYYRNKSRADDPMANLGS